MARRSRGGIVAGRIAACAILLVTACAAPAGAQWRRVDTPNFVILGDVSAAVLRDTAIQFEGFRETLGRVLGDRVTAASVPTVVMVFQSDSAIAPYRPKFQGKPVDVAGVFVPGRDVNFIAIVHDGQADRLRVVFHEYTHLVASGSGQPLPVWLSEGLAEYYSTFELNRNGREAILGRLIDSHLATLNNTVLIPIDDLIKVDHQSPLYNEGSRRSVFYAEAWALTHRILLGEPNCVPQLSAYLGKLAEGEPEIDAWREAFAGLDMQKELEGYIRRQLFRAFKYTFTDAVAKFDARAAAVPPTDVLAFQADLLVQLGDLDAAASRLAQARKKDPGNPRLAVSTLRLALARKDAVADAAPFGALDAPADWFLAYLGGIAAADLAERMTPVPDLGLIRRWLGAAGTGRQEFPNAVVRLAGLELRSDAGPSAETTAAIARLRQRLPDRPEYAFLQARLLIGRRAYAEARAAIGPLLAGPYPASVKTTARNLMGAIVEMEHPQSGEASGSGTPSGSTLRPAFRQLQDGEQRIDGLLINIECVQGKGITFHVKTGDQTQTAVASSLSNVAFITYRSDLTGSIQCGPLAAPMAVYLTWRPGPGGARTAVAVEFLPQIEPGRRDLGTPFAAPCRLRDRRRDAGGESRD